MKKMEGKKRRGKIVKKNHLGQKTTASENNKLCLIKIIFRIYLNMAINMGIKSINHFFLIIAHILQKIERRKTKQNSPKSNIFLSQK